MGTPETDKLYTILRKEDIEGAPAEERALLHERINRLGELGLLTTVDHSNDHALADLSHHAVCGINPYTREKLGTMDYQQFGKAAQSTTRPGGNTDRVINQAWNTLLRPPHINGFVPVFITSHFNPNNKLAAVLDLPLLVQEIDGRHITNYSNAGPRMMIIYAEVVLHRLEAAA